jgi:hypothetical protein
VAQEVAMSTIQSSQAIAVAKQEDVASSGSSPWLVLAGTVLGLAGVMRVIDAVWAFGYKASLPENLEDGILGSNIKTYAWMWLIVGIILIAASGLVLFRSQFARWIGFAAAALGAISAMAWMPYYPVWSLAYIGLAVLVFYALARYGGRETA